MTPTLASDLFRSALWAALEVCAPPLAVITALAVIIGILQAATQVQDSSVSFTPKLAGGLAILWLGSAWMASMLGGFMHKALTAIPLIVKR